MSRSRSWVWLQIIGAWLPVLVLYGLLLVTAHPEVRVARAAASAVWAITVAALLGIFVQKLADRLPLTRPVSFRLLLIHFAAALLYSTVWVVLTSHIQIRVHGVSTTPFEFPPLAFMVLGIWLYLIVVGFSYATKATERAARAEALAANSQLAALRSQLNPHFLFNALHSVIQLIPRQPQLAATAAEQLAGLLRSGIEENRDLVLLSEEIAFVERYLSLERIRFGDRLNVTMSVGDDAAAAVVPSFSVQSLVENAVRHGAEPREEPTSIDIHATRRDGTIEVTVRDSGMGSTTETVSESTGTGLTRLRERLAVLYGTNASLDVSSSPGTGFTAKMVIPYSDDD
jgi:hypothetical protein